MKALGEKIKNLRLKKLLTQEDIAKHLGVKQPTVSTWESGLFEPSIENLIKLSDLLGCDMNELLNNQ